MKIVHLNTYEGFGGAGIAGNRLVAALNELEPDCATMLHGALAQVDGHLTHQRPWPKLFTKLNFAADAAYFSMKSADPKYRFAFSPGIFGRDLSNWKQVKEADIIHLHWFNQGFLSLDGLRKLLALNKPIVWTLHDTWAFTGGCHYPGSCDHFKEQCGDCYYLKNPDERDLSNEGWLRKKKLYSTAKNIAFITCSNWLAGIATQSSLIGRSRIEAIPNPIDTKVFYPQQKGLIRRKWNIGENSRLILFGAANINDRRKGITYLVEALHKYIPSAGETIEVAFFGKNKSFNTETLPFKAHDLSIISSQAEMSEIYSMADVFILPSLEDNLPNTVMESMACGTPAIAFRTGGLSDMIDHKINGYLADYKSSDDIAMGIDYVLTNPDLGYRACETVIKDFSNSIVAGQYFDVYRSVLNAG